ncbi:uncharacterized protein LOC101855904 [Aplysia californica]|uniref:Uncharacterized protein LOC101855904 n=1 Tax=Aplysia californica TaxID=6500 RepID=A0ABM0K5K3_APLCA|nr:uncharacterized protein LOC101855904 [Aplysia californica]
MMWSCFLALALAVSFANGKSFNPKMDNEGAILPPDLPAVCGTTCGPPITVTLKVKNQHQAPYFESEMQLSGSPQRTLFSMMQEAADKNPSFNFAVSYHGSVSGFHVTTINQLASSLDTKTYWKILEHPMGNSLSQGVSDYVPLDGAVVMFNFTTWATQD